MTAILPKPGDHDGMTPGESACEIPAAGSGGVRYLRPWLSEAASHAMTLDLLEASVDVEHLWRCGWDPERRCLTSAELLCRGSQNRTVYDTDEFLEGEMAVHSHPSGSTVEPSCDDLQSAMALARYGVGFAIVDRTLANLLVVREPRRFARLAAIDAIPALRSRIWRLSTRWQLIRYDLP